MSPKTPETSMSSDGEMRALVGAERARHVAYEAIIDLWLKRQAEGLRKKDIATALSKHPAWVTRALAGPANWQIETLGALVEALNGVMEISVTPVEDVHLGNFDFYADVIHGAQHGARSAAYYVPGSQQTAGSSAITLTSLKPRPIAKPQL